MNGKERDALLEHQTDLLGKIASKLERKPERSTGVPKLPPRPRLQLDGLPGWDFDVPDEHVEAGDFLTVNCRCGAATVLTMRIPMACDGDCGRYFLRTRAGSVKVKRFNDEEEAQAA